MPKVSTYTRKRIQSLHEQNLHPVEIFKVLKGEDLAVSYQSVARIVNKLKLTGSTNNLPRSGRPRKINPEAQAFNEEQTRRNDETTSREIQKKLAKHGLIVHASTIRQSRKEQGWTHKHDTANWSGKPTKSRDWSSPSVFWTLEIHSIMSSSPTNALSLFSSFAAHVIERSMNQQRESQNLNTHLRFMFGLVSAGVVPRKSVFLKE